MHRVTRAVSFIGVAGATLAAIVVGAAPASAHINPDKTEVPAGAYDDVTLTVPHGCDDLATTQLDIQIPEGLTSVSPMVHPGWEIDVEEEDLNEPIVTDDGEEITTRTSKVTFTAQDGNELDPHLRDAFTIGFKAPDTPGESLFFKTIQHCGQDAQTDWIEEYTGEGEEPEHPAPVVMVTEAEGDGHGGTGGDDAGSGDGELASAGDTEAGDAEAADTEAASDASGEDSDDSATALATVALVASLLGLAFGGFALFRVLTAPPRTTD